jgi:hypothetical protein
MDTHSNEPQEAARFDLTTALFLRLLGLAFVFAFSSLWCQIPGLIGRDGIFPASVYLKTLSNYAGPAAYLSCPTLAWVNSSNLALESMAATGTVLALLAVLGISSPALQALLYLLYLSLVNVGRTFLQFQWDALLCEAGFLAIFIAGRQGKDKNKLLFAPNAIVIWMFRWLLFRVMFLSGAVKLLSGDGTYRNLTALTYHWYTQPLPTPVAWYLEQLPLLFQKFAEVSMFAAELLVPLLIFAPGKFRRWGGVAIIIFQFMIAITGNYCFFNFLTMSMCVFLFDDSCFARLNCKPMRAILGLSSERKLGSAPAPVIVYSTAAVLFCASFSTFSENFLGPEMEPPLASALAALLAPFSVTNGYGVFAVMTTKRHEIIVEGSRDGSRWLPYEFRYKPGDLKRAPPWVAPHQPRLDWQMWFAALGSIENNRWFGSFVYQLLKGSPAVLALLVRNPFADAPPKFIRASLYDYHFTDWSERNTTGAWWRREYAGEYMPAVSLSDFEEPASSGP